MDPLQALDVFAGQQVLPNLQGMNQQPQAVQGNAPVAPQQQQQPQAFAATPAIFFAGPLDFSNKVQHTVYLEGAKPLKTEFDCSEDRLKIFLDQLQGKINNYGWRPIFTIPVNTIDRFLPTQWGQVTLDQVHTHLVGVHGNQDRNHQNSVMSGECIYNSLTIDAQNKVSSYANKYTIGGLISGPILLRALIAVTHIDTRASADQLLTELERLDEKMIALESNIESFNHFVNRKLAELHARGQDDAALLTHLFHGYEAVSDEEFVAWAKRKHSDVDDGENLDAETLMNLALQKYSDRKQCNLWSKPSPQDESIIALETDIKQLKSAFKSKAKNTDKSKSKKDANPQKGKKQKNKRKVDPWKLKPPAEGSPKTKVVNGKTYHFCLNHNDGKGQWTIHLPSACKQDKKTGNTQQQQQGNVHFNQAALTSILEGSDEE